MRKPWRFLYYFLSISLAYYILLNFPEWHNFLAFAFGFSFAGLRYDIMELKEEKEKNNV